MKKQAFEQFWACFSTLYPVQDAPVKDDFAQGAETQQLITDWYRDFYQDLYESKAGYPLNQSRVTPELEDRLVSFAKAHRIDTDYPRIKQVPTLCLTHDIDYLWPTVQMAMKQTISERRLCWPSRQNAYLQSIERLLQLDVQYAGQDGVSTLFLAHKKPARSLRKRLTQWLIDPSYSLDDPYFQDILTLIHRFKSDVGIHGSYFSLEDRLLKEEIQALEKVTGHPIKAGRQHWLNLPGHNAMERIYEAGLTIDSTLGWNGTYGFRCGMARPFPLVLPQGQLWEVPMPLMDGPLFNDMKLSSAEVINKATTLLGLVYDRGGCVALNWHDRAAHPDFNWDEAYKAILEWASNKGFRFTTLSKAVEEYKQSYVPVHT